MVRRAAFLGLLISLLASPALSQVTSSTASTGKTSYLVGDYINYKIQIRYKPGTTVFPPMIQDSLKDLTLLKVEKPSKTIANGDTALTYAYVLSCYDSAGVTIPGIPIFCKTAGDTALQVVPTNPVRFTVSTVKVNLKEGIKDVNAPIKIPFDWKWLLVWIGAALLIAVITYYLYRRYKKKKAAASSVKPAVKVLPHEEALSSLHQLEQQQLWQRGLVKEYHSAITEIIRRYFEKRFNMPAMELPTSEAVELLKLRPESAPILDLTYGFLSNADMVKFAKFTPMNSVNEEMMKQAYEIVNKTAVSNGKDGKETGDAVQ
jgi:hypothetical protein